MNVRDLINRLQQLDGDREVVVRTEAGAAFVVAVQDNVRWDPFDLDAPSVVVIVGER
jgi:hypothetical protein